VVSTTGTIAVDGGEKDLASSPLFDLSRPFQWISCRVRGSIRSHHAIATKAAFVVDGDDNALTSKSSCRRGDKLGLSDSVRVEHTLARAGAEQHFKVSQARHSPTSADGHETEPC